MPEKQPVRESGRSVEDTDFKALLEKLTAIGIALSAERDHEALLERILTESRELAGCDAASLFLIKTDGEGKKSLIFKLAQNESRPVSFSEVELPLTDDSIVGHVALSGEEINLADAYNLPQDASYSFNQSIDREENYRSTSLLALPMRTPQQQMIGVLEFINRKRDPDELLDDPATIPDKTLPFSDDISPILRSLASQAAVAIANNQLLADIHNMFEGFVTASVTAIEQRDPTTSGHSFRVATLTTSLADMIPRSGLHRFRDIRFSEQQRREIQYASLLHDFGKVGVREHILQKANKLPEIQLERILHRIELEKERLRIQALEKQLAMVKQGSPADDAWQTIQPALDKKLQELGSYQAIIEEANQPSILHKEKQAALELPHAYRLSHDGSLLLNNEDYRILSIPKGSLTDDERLEIESHVTHTWNFLNRIPWPEELANVPAIAGAHHEKLDGKGYPFGLQAEEIPFPARMMTVSDIYDALTARDRPYKKAMPVEKALSIIEAEAKDGRLDQDIVSVFIDAKVFSSTAV